MELPRKLLPSLRDLRQIVLELLCKILMILEIIFESFSIWINFRFENLHVLNFQMFM